MARSKADFQGVVRAIMVGNECQKPALATISMGWMTLLVDAHEAGELLMHCGHGHRPEADVLPAVGLLD